MKNITLLSFVCLAFAGTATAQVGGPDCATPVALPAGPQVVATNTAGASASGTLNSCHNTGTPSDHFYTWSPTVSGVHVFDMCNGGAGSAGYDSCLGLYDVGCATQIVCNDDGTGCGGFSSLMSANVTAGTTYLIQVGGFGMATGTGSLDISSAGLPPANDDCANAIALPGGPTSTPFDSTNATTDGLAPSCGAAFTTPNNIWYTWSPLMDGSYAISTIGASFPSRITLFSGCAGVEIACDTNGAGDASVSSSLLAASTYTIMVAGNGTETGLGTLDIIPTPPPGAGDDCTTANPLPSGTQSVPLDNTAATQSGTLPSCGGGTLPFDVWYSWAPNSSGDWLFSTCNMNSFDTRIAMRTACTGIEIACNDDAAGCAGFSTEMIASGLVANTTYFVQTGGFNAAQGTATMDISTVGGPPPVGVNYCQTSPNSAGAGAIMTATGSGSVAANDLSLTAGPMAPNEPGIFFYGPTALTPIQFGNGFRCVGGGAGTVVRIFPFSNGGATGTLMTTIDNTNPVHAQIVPGAVLHFQAWFRDPAGGGTGFNLSDGMTIVFGP